MLALVKGLYDAETKSEVLSKVVQMNLEETVAFVEAREIGRRDVQSLGGGLLSGQVNAVLIQGRCWRCNQEGHRGRAQAHIRKISCKAFNATYKKCNLVGHYTSVCKRGEKRTKDPTFIGQ